MKVLITGGSGLVGSEFANLETNHELILLSRSDVNLLNYKDTLLFFQKAKPDAIIHLAAKVGGVKANTEFVAEFYRDNVQMNINVMEVARILGCKLVSAMSTCIYPDAKYVDYPITENQLHLGPPHDSNFGYAYAKRMLDIQARSYRQQWGCNFINVIPNNLYGPNDNYDLESGHVIPSLVRKFSEAKFNNLDSVVMWGTGVPMREFTFARDASKITLWLLENYDEKEPINIGCTDEICIRDLSEKIKKIVGYNGKIVWDSSKPEGQFRKPTSNANLIKLGWKEKYTQLDDGLLQTIKHFESQYPKLRGIK